VVIRAAAVSRTVQRLRVLRLAVRRVETLAL
jgi:hypothetical protein